MTGKPCPFCCSQDLYVEHGDYDSTYIKCNQCFAEGPALIAAWEDMEEGEAEAKAWELWNKRAQYPAVEEGEAA